MSAVIELFVDFYLVLFGDLWWLMYLHMRFLKWNCYAMNSFFMLAYNLHRVVEIGFDVEVRGEMSFRGDRKGKGKRDPP